MDIVHAIDNNLTLLLSRETLACALALFWLGSLCLWGAARLTKPLDG